uniref:Anaphase-promoting complex subunit 13 n=2 Tax=Crassostrea virginica TaxID=6565 RepID=A0A8B8CZP9_CRAVI|nr:anaphase-promoting complex subunit 13-like isoform X1 [Crassostrea virginica]
MDPDQQPTQIDYFCVPTLQKQKKKEAMDSQVARDGRLMELVDEKWRDDKLPMEEVAVPQMELPEIEPDNGPTNETLKEQEQKWSDLALSALHDQPPTTANH